MAQPAPQTVPELKSVVQMILLAAPQRLDPNALQQSLARELDDATIKVQASPGRQAGSSAMVSWGDTVYAVISIDQPIPTDTFETALRISYQLEGGDRLIDAHRAHLIVSPISGAKDTDQAIANAIGVMRLSAALTGQAKVLGYYWSNAQVLTDPAGYAEAVARAEAALAAHQAGQADAWSGVPLNLWLGMHLIPDQKVQGYGVTSEGLRSFTGFEIAIAPYRIEAAAVARHLFNIAGYLLGSGARFNDGDTLGVSATEQFRAHNLPAEGEQPPLLVLSMESTN
jgi:hypothetical protein